MMNKTFRRTLVATAAIAIGGLTFIAQGQSQEEFAQRRYDSGRAFYDSGKYAEALRDFQAVVESYPATSVADDALMDIAAYQLDVAGDPAAALTFVEALLKKYPNADSAPMALVMQGRITLARGLSNADIDSALANFDRVPRLFPGTPAVPAALYYAGRALRLGNRNDEALDRYSQVASDYPSSIWAMRARQGMAISFTLTGNPTRAMQELQRIRQTMPNSPEAATALAWNTILYRLYVRTPAQPAFGVAKRSVAGPGGKIKDVLAIAGDSANRLYVVNKGGVQIFDEKGTVTGALKTPQPTGIFLDSRGQPVAINETSLSPDGQSPLVLTVTQPDGKIREVKDLTAGAAMSAGDYLVANPDVKAIERFSTSGEFIGRFAVVDADRLAIDFLDNVAALERGAKTVTIFNRDGKPIGKVLPKGANYELREPVDLAFDALGHLYVLDRNRGTVFVFGSNGTKLITSFSIPDRTPGSFFHARALGLDTAGRLYIFDDDEERIQVYQ